MSNYKFKTTNIRGKQYVEVNERIKFFRQEEQYKGWSISTAVVHMNTDEVVMCTSIIDSNGSVIDADSIVNEELSLYTAMLAVVRCSGGNASFPVPFPTKRTIVSPRHTGDSRKEAEKVYLAARRHSL